MRKNKLLILCILIFFVSVVSFSPVLIGRGRSYSLRSINNNKLLLRLSNNFNNFGKMHGDYNYDIKEYEFLLEKTFKKINELNTIIDEAKREGVDERELSLFIVEKLDSVAFVNDCKYKILFLQKHGKFNEDEKKTAINFLTNELISLKNELNLKEKYFDDYKEKEFSELENLIKNVEDLIKGYNNIYNTIQY